MFWCSHFMHAIVVLFMATSRSACSAWKPIVGQSAASGVGFSLHQSHPAVKHLKLRDTSGRSELDLSPPSSSAEATIDEFEALSLASVHAAEVDPYSALNGYKYDDSGAREYREGMLGQDACAVPKYAFNHDGTVYYNTKIPELEQFTICYWMRFTNHSGDHVMLTYAAKDEKRALQLWVANSKNSSFLSMAIKGQQVYRLNYPLRTRQWHHTCTSWNGKTGEWQVWLRAERIGRGFHNAVVGYKISPNGKLYSGGPSFTGAIAEGLHFEMTLIQIYRVALSAGKAHRDHKHHHAHHFSHDGQELSTTTRAPPKINRPLPMHSLLANGQIPTSVRINFAKPVQLAGAAAIPVPPAPSTTSTGSILPQQPSIADNIARGSPENQGFTIHTNFINGQFHSGSRLVTQQLIGLPAGPRTRPSITHRASTHSFNSLHNPNNVQFIDETETSVLFKRETASEKPVLEVTAANDGFNAEKTPSKPELDKVSTHDKLQLDSVKTTSKQNEFDSVKTPIKPELDSVKVPRKREFDLMKAFGKRDSDLMKTHDKQDVDSVKTHNKRDLDSVKTHNKRDLVLLQDGSIVDESDIDGFGYQFDGLAEFGGKKFKNDLTLKMNIEDEIREHDREPAEDEVKAVMALCGRCDLEPFLGAIVFAWKNVIAESDNALRGSSVGRCGNF